MGNGYATPPVGDFGQLMAVLKDTQRRLAQLEAPDGSQVADALKTLTDIVNGLATLVNGVFSGYVSAGTYITAAGDITSTGGYLVSPAGPGFDITTGRVAAWWRTSDGRLAFASSSREKKTNIVDADIDPTAVLAISIRAFNYKAEIAKRDDPKSPEYVGPKYHVALEVGGIAEELHDLGLWPVVIYKDHWKPIGIHYELLGLLAIKATQYVWNEHLALRKAHNALARDVEALKKLAGL